MKLKILAIAVLGIVGIGAAIVAVGGLPASASTGSKFLTSAATTGDVTDDVAASGTVATTASYGLSFGAAPHLAGAAADGGSTAWTVSKLNVAVGDTVKKGDVLATADTTELKRQLADATDAWRVARIQQTIAEEALADASGTDPVRQATMNLYNAQTQLSNAQATRRTLADQLAAATLKAPIDGVVTAVNVVEGLAAPTGDAIVVDSTGLQVTAQVVESDLAKIVVGQTASVSISAVGADVTGKVTSIAPTATDSSSSNGVVSYAATIVLTDPPATVRAGMTADVTITVANASGVLTVPAAALRGSAGNYTVLLLDATGQPVAQPVTVGLITASLAEIKSGLTEGQEVVTGVNTAQNQATNSSNNNGGGFNRGFGGGGFGGGGGTGPKIVTGP
jgi:macrolide-specific efflux system membrane fusion protein